MGEVTSQITQQFNALGSSQSSGERVDGLRSGERRFLARLAAASSGSSAVPRGPEGIGCQLDSMSNTQFDVWYGTTWVQWHIYIYLEPGVFGFGIESLGLLGKKLVQMCKLSY